MSACSLESTEIDSNQLHLKSFWGLFLVCGLACCTALVIYFVQILRKYHNAPSIAAKANGSVSSRSGRLQTLLSLMDDKSDSSKTGHKKRRVERSLSEDSRVDESSHSKRNQTQNSAEITDAGV